MSHHDLLIIWPGSTLLSVLLWIGVAVALLYLARFPAHRAIISFSRMLHGALRLASRSTLLLERRVVGRTREVMINAGVEERELALERGFHRIAEPGGGYSVSEDDPTSVGVGWTIVSATCDDGSDPRVSIDVSLGEKVVCTFTSMLHSKRSGLSVALLAIQWRL